MCLSAFFFREEASEKASHGRPFPSRSVEGSALCRAVKEGEFLPARILIFSKNLSNNERR